MEDRVILLCGLVLIMTKQCLGVPLFQDVECASTGKVSYRVAGAANYYLKSSLCSKKIRIPNNALGWYTIGGSKCDYTLGESNFAQLTENEFGIFNAADDDVKISYVCSASGLPPIDVQLDFDSLTQTTGTPTIIPIDPEITVKVYSDDCKTPLSGPVHPGEQLCMVIRIEDGFKDLSMQIQTIKVKSPGKRWHVLTGGDGMPGCATSKYFNAGIWPQVQQFPDSAKQRALFPAFVISDSSAPEEQTFEITVLICQHSNLAECDTNYQGCFPALPPTTTTAASNMVRRKRDLDETAQLQLSASVLVNPRNGTGKVLSNTDGNSGTSTASNIGDSARQTGNDAEAARQTGTEPCEVCMRRSVLYGLIGFFIPALVLAFGASFCFWLRTRKQNKKVEDEEIVTRRPVSMRRSSFRNSGYTY